MTREELSRSGIYLIHNNINGKNYVGQAENIAVRWNEHKRDFRSNDHSNDHLQGAYRKYGAEAFEWSVLEFCPLELLDEREIYWIAEKEAYTKGYNLTKGGGGVRGFYDIHGKKVVCIETDTEYASIATAARETKANRKSIYLCCTFQAKTANGFHWRFEEMPNDVWEQKFTDRFDRIPSHYVPVVCIDTGEAFHSINAAAKAKGISDTAIAVTCQGKHYTAGGLRWKYQSTSDEEYASMIDSLRNKSDDWKRRRLEILQSDSSKKSASNRMKDRMNFNQDARGKALRGLLKAAAKKRRSVVQVETGVVFPSFTHAAMALGVKSSAHIVSCCTGKRTVAYGYHWRYAD